MKKVILTCLIIMLMFGNMVEIRADDAGYNGICYVNQDELKNGEVLFVTNERYSSAFFPLSDIFESLGATLSWKHFDRNSPEKQSIEDLLYINYQGNIYTIRVFALDENNDVRIAFVKNAAEPFESDSINSLLELGLSSHSGQAKYINNKLYVYPYAMKKIMDFFGYDIRIDYQNAKAYIFKSTGTSMVDSMKLDQKSLYNGSCYIQKGTDAIEIKFGSIGYDNYAFIPLRKVFEALGGEVRWEGVEYEPWNPLSGTRAPVMDRVFLDFKDGRYILETREKDGKYPAEINLKKVGEEGETDIPLFTPFSSLEPIILEDFDNDIEYIDDYIYMYYCTAEKLLAFFGYKISVDYQSSTVYISK